MESTILANLGVVADERMDRSIIQFAKQSQLEAQDDAYWKNAPLEEKLRATVYLRECFYGPEATTGRLQRFFEFSKLKQG